MNPEIPNSHNLESEANRLKRKFLTQTFDPKYIEKSKKSICKTCVNNLGFDGEIYECKAANEALTPFDIYIDYKREGVFHAEIIRCNKYSEKNSEYR